MLIVEGHEYRVAVDAQKQSFEVRKGDNTVESPIPYPIGAEAWEKLNSPNEWRSEWQLGMSDLRINNRSGYEELYATVVAG